LVAAFALNVSAGPPRYRFSLGQKLEYEGKTQGWTGEEDPEESLSSFTIWVTGVNDDGTWDLVIESIPMKDEHNLTKLTLHPDGRYDLNPTFAYLSAWMSPRRVLPMLPSEAEWTAGRWTLVEPRTAVCWEYSVKDAAALSAAFGATCRGPLEIVSVGEMQFQWEFDAASGAIAKYHETGTWEDYKARDETFVTLKKNSVLDAEAIAKVRDESDLLFEMLAAYRRVSPRDHAMSVRKSAAGGIDLLFRERSDLLEVAAGKLTFPAAKSIAERQIKQVADFESYSREDMAKLAALVDKESPAWTANDIDGRPHALADYRGQVVVLDFWFRKCNYCIRVQPQMDAVVEHFRGKPVTFLGMNVDKDIADAKFTVEKLHTPYPTLQAGHVQKLYKRNGCPAWIIIDQKGIVRSVLGGYSGEMQEELIEAIGKLLD